MSNSDQPPSDSGDVLQSLYHELRALAGQYLQRVDGKTLQPTAIVHEAYLRLAGNQELAWNSRSHFYAISARAMRNVLVDHARSNAVQKRGGGHARVTLSGLKDTDVDRDVDLIALTEAMDRLRALDERQGQIVELRFFGGLSVDEIAEEIGISPRTVKNDWRMAKAWLRTELDEEDAT